MSFRPAISSAKAVPAQTDSLNESGNTPSVSFSTNDSLIFRYSFTGSIPKVLIELFQFSLFKPQVVGYWSCKLWLVAMKTRAPSGTRTRTSFRLNTAVLDCSNGRVGDLSAANKISSDLEDKQEVWALVNPFVPRMLVIRDIVNAFRIRICSILWIAVDIRWARQCFGLLRSIWYYVTHRMELDLDWTRALTLNSRFAPKPMLPASKTACEISWSLLLF